MPSNARMRPTSWFPDGNHMLAADSTDSEEGPSLWSVSVLGGSPRRLLVNARDGSVSPDGTQIAFIRGNGKDQEIWLSSAWASNSVKSLVKPEQE